MVASTIEQQILEQVRRLNDDQKRDVLNFVRTLKDRPRGITGKELIAFAASLNFDPEDLRLMERAIEEDCERIDPDWDKPDIDFDKIDAADSNV